MKHFYHSKHLRTGFTVTLFLISVLTAYGQAPSVTTNPASSITTTSASLNGSVLTTASAAVAHFDWGTSILYDNVTPNIVVGTASAPVPISFILSSLTPNSTYHFRAAAGNDNGTTDGPDQSFTTAAAPPVVTTQPAQNVGSVSARLVGTVNPNNSPTDARFEWGTTIAYGNFTTITSLSAGTSPVTTTFDLSGLSPSTPYHYRATASNPGGTTNGLDQVFTTPVLFPLPVVVTGTAEDLTIASANLVGSVNPNGSPATVHFEYGATNTYGNVTPDLSGGSSTSSVTVKFKILGLSANATYHFRAVATNTGGTSFGGDQVFHTPSPGASQVPLLTPAGITVLALLFLLSAALLVRRKGMDG